MKFSELRWSRIGDRWVSQWLVPERPAGLGACRVVRHDDGRRFAVRLYPSVGAQDTGERLWGGLTADAIDIACFLVEMRRGKR